MKPCRCCSLDGGGDIIHGIRSRRSCQALRWHSCQGCRWEPRVVRPTHTAACSSLASATAECLATDLTLGIRLPCLATHCLLTVCLYPTRLTLSATRTAPASTAPAPHPLAASQPPARGQLADVMNPVTHLHLRGDQIVEVGLAKEPLHQLQHQPGSPRFRGHTCILFAVRRADGAMLRGFQLLMGTHPVNGATGKYPLALSV